MQTPFAPKPASTGSRRTAEPLATPPLSPDRAFVIHFHPPHGRGRVAAGKVEHVRSGRVLRFSTVPQLLEFVTALVVENERRR